jgi:large subunit ribosomal protein L29
MSAVTEELRGMDTEELETRLNETRQELFNLRFQLVTGQLDNSSRITQVRRHVARIETLLREREIAEAEELEAGQIAAVSPHREPKSRPITGVVLTVPHEEHEEHEDHDAHDELLDEEPAVVEASVPEEQPVPDEAPVPEEEDVHD